MEKTFISTLTEVSLNIMPHDNICIICDSHGLDMANAIQTAINEQAIIMQVNEKLICDNLPIDLRKVLLGDSYNVLIICIKNEQDVWHSIERKKAKYDLCKRLVSVIVPYDFLRGKKIEINPPLIKSLGDAVKKHFIPGSKLRVVTNSGTDVYAEIEGPFLENGDYSKPGTGGDFPSGEVGFSPKEFSVSGKIVYDLKIQHMGLVNSGDVEIEIEKDLITKISGRRGLEFEKLLLKNEILYYISEISFGINPYIEIFNNKSNIIEEKKAGTIHFGHGGNAAYGNRVGPHFDCVIDSPTAYLNGSLFMKDGKFVPSNMPQSIYSDLENLKLIYNEK